MPFDTLVPLKPTGAAYADAPVTTKTIAAFASGATAQ
jgi:hypothetical protein